MLFRSQEFLRGRRSPRASSDPIARDRRCARWRFDRRAILARALATEADFLLLDEPTANLDLSHQSSLLGVVRSRCDTREVAALFVTHDINLAAQFADTVILMHKGRMIQSGKPADVLQPKALEDVFGVKVLVDEHPVTGVPRVTTVHA